MITTEQFLKACGCRSVGECTHNLDAEALALDRLVDAFSFEMKKRLQQKRSKGWSGWEDKYYKPLIGARLFDEARNGGNEVDIANFAAMLWNFRQPDAPLQPLPDTPARPESAATIMGQPRPADTPAAVAPLPPMDLLTQLRTALRFYARGEHTAGLDTWEEEEGWLCPAEGEAMVEAGGIARAALQGKLDRVCSDDLPDPDANWHKPIDGEVVYPQKCMRCDKFIDGCAGHSDPADASDTP